MRAQKKREPIVWIKTDHMRYDCVAVHGYPAVYTPNLDRLAAGGVSFSRCHANNPVCMPSRCSLTTGCFPPQTGVTWNGQESKADFKPTYLIILTFKPTRKKKQGVMSSNFQAVALHPWTVMSAEFTWVHRMGMDVSYSIRRNELWNPQRVSPRELVRKPATKM